MRRQYREYGKMTIKDKKIRWKLRKYKENKEIRKKLTIIRRKEHEENVDLIFST